jgi:hypothetical protein
MRESAPDDFAQARFWMNVAPCASEDDCYLWVGNLDEDGYGTFNLKGEKLRAHRVVYEMEVGPIPAGLTIDHTCGTRACVNSRHLEPTTNSENLRRSHRSGRRQRKVAA